MDHFSKNMNLMVISGMSVHRRYGRNHTLVAFFGGGVTGNLFQYALYLHQKINWKEIFPSPKSMVTFVFGESTGEMIASWQSNVLEKLFSSVNAWRPCIGASAAIASFIAIEACTSAESLVRKVQRIWERRAEHFTGNYAFESACELFKVVVASLIMYEDMAQLLDHSIKPKGLISSLVGYAGDGIGHAAHMGGFLFGLLYYIFVLHKVPPQEPED